MPTLAWRRSIILSCPLRWFRDFPRISSTAPHFLPPFRPPCTQLEYLLAQKENARKAALLAQ